MREAIAAGLGFLARTQRRDGLWHGFMLLPGASTDWITAHVAYLLEELPQAQALRERAADALLAHVRTRPGWGYNLRVGIDSDSSAQALIVLHRAGQEIAPAWVERLLAAREEDGGFATFLPSAPGGRAYGWWEMPHADVTLIALDALARLGGHEQACAAARAWLAGQAVDGVLPAYWWTSPAYSLWAQARAGFDPAGGARIARGLLAQERRPVYLAMLLAAALAGEGASQQSDAAAAALLRVRLADGSWPCHPCLRTTDPGHAGGFDAPGRVYADRFRAFSTAHAVAALARALEAREDEGHPAPRQQAS
ncbi:MAG TPA: hypothetical protein VL979_12670 [Solirubrobacteraceae bacterium]|nr:hypothetical protein [Solirubrobacteraceae bacterium]